MIKFNVVGNEIFDFNVKQLIKKILKKTSKKLSIKKKHFVSYIFVDLDEIHRINKEYRQIDRPTDVISFAYIDDEVENVIPEELGDIFICNEKVYEQAKEYGHSEYRECAFLITHGLLHLLGYDHMEKEEEEVMFRLQNEILNELGMKR